MSNAFFALMGTFLFYGFFQTFVFFWVAFYENDFEQMINEMIMFGLCVVSAIMIFVAWRSARKKKRRRSY